MARALARANCSGEGALAVGEEGQWEEGMLGSGYSIASGQANQLQVSLTRVQICMARGKSLPHLGSQLTLL